MLHKTPVRRPRSTFLRGARTALAILASLCMPQAFAADNDADFLAAHAAFESGQRATLDQLAPRLKGHRLEAYVDYWRLRASIDTAPDDAVRAFMRRYSGTALADGVRSDWLKSLARRAQWATFRVEYAAQTNDDTELTCYALQHRWQYDPESALTLARPLWFTGRALPDACEPLVTALAGQNRITHADRRARLRLAVQVANWKLVESLSNEMLLDDRIGAHELAQIERDPAKALGKGDFRWNRGSGRELALIALERAARRDASGVRAAWERVRRNLPEADRVYGNARIAYYAAQQLLPAANDWYREARGASLNDAEHAWRARAALRAGAWADVLAAIDAMPPPMTDETAWRYWKARALAATGRSADAQALYAALASGHNFYALLAAEALGRGAEKLQEVRVPMPAAASADAVAAFAAREDVRRALGLAQLELRRESQREWTFIVRDLEDEALLVAAEYARRQGLYDRAINTAERTAWRHDFRMRYLMPYREAFAAAAREHELDEAILLGLARQESRFNPAIVSSAGAVGLMQLMPATARWVAKQVGKPESSVREITDVALNTQFGAYYFRYWFDRLERLPALAAAAYNAGPGRAQAWRAAAPLEGAVWVETIPFNETRDYVKKVLANAMYYARELDQPYVSLSARLGTIPPRGVSASAFAAAQ